MSRARENRTNRRSIGMRLVEALTGEQIVRLLDAVFMIWDKERVKELVSVVGEDVASTLSRLLDPRGSPRERVVSDDKIMEEWRGLWEEWEEVVSELGLEHGRYVFQVHHWEEPYFATESFSADLDRVAEKMLPLLDRVNKIGEEDEDVFEGALVEIESGIKGYPDWMGADQEGCELGPATTQCVLTWGWLSTSSAPDLVKRTTDLNNRFRIVRLCQAAPCMPPRNR